MRSSIIIIMVLLLGLMACAPAQEDSSESSEVQQVTIGVGFIPNIQFAPFYVAQAKGFYAEQGIEVSLEYGFENDFVLLTAGNERQFTVASGDQVILARAQDLPLTYVMKWYERYPVAVIAPSDSDIASPADLSGHTVGIPGKFGASYVAWKALAQTNQLDESSINVAEIGFTQAEALSTDKVDAAVVYIANEPIQLAEEGIDTTMFEVSDYIDLISNGLVTNETVMAENPELVKKVVAGTLKGLAYTLENPDEAFSLSREFVTDITDELAPTQRKVLDASLELWHSDTPGQTTEAAWQASLDFMRESGLIEREVQLPTLYSNDFLP